MSEQRANKQLEPIVEGLGEFRKRLQWMEENPPARLVNRVEESSVDLEEVCGKCGGRVHDEGPEHLRVCRCDGALRRCAELLDAADPERRMTFSTLDGLDRTLLKASKTAARVATGEATGLVMLGTPGVGKTHIAVAACREALAERTTAGFYNVVEIVGRIQDTYGGASPDSPGRTEIIRQIASREIVVLDDLGKEHASDNVDSIIYELVNTIYCARRRLIVCTNLTPRMFAERYDEAVKSRIAGLCESVHVRGEDRRRLR